jgi:pimeloyl-ACP methyl ester carboxylesterase
MVTRSEVTVEAHPAFVWIGGVGDAVLFLHGAWAGAEVHWGRVWDRFAEHHRVVAPDFPGLGYDTSWVPRSFDETVRWVDHVLDATHTRRAWVIGNSFGAAVAARLASELPERCLGLVLVDGGPTPYLPSVLRSLLKRWPLRRLIEEIFRRSAYSKSTLRRAFADSARAPAEVRDLLAQRRPRQLRILSEMVFSGDPAVPPPQLRTLIVWGADDHLSTLKAAERLKRSLPNARLAIIPGAGHLPQVEQPDQFVTTVLDYMKGG